MERFRLGQTGMMVSRVGFGGIPIQRVTEDEAISVTRRCLDLGVNFIDTSHVYGTSEERIGRAIAGRRDGLIIATKSTSRTAEGIKSDLNMSLERLGIDSIDLYQFHNVRTIEDLELVLDPGGLWSVVTGAKKAGTIKHIGITSHSPEVAIEAAKTGRFETIMIPFNFVSYLPYVSSSLQSNALLPLVRERDIGLIAMKPLAGGRIPNITIAFKYLFQFPGVLPLVGIEKEAEIEEIAAIAEAPSPLSETERREMAQIIEELGSRFCRQCGYCQPCPQGIKISSVLRVRHLSRRQGPEKIFTGNYIGVMEKVADCIECGDCESKCPYDLSVMKMLVEEAEWFQTERRKFLEQSQD